MILALFLAHLFYTIPWYEWGPNLGACFNPPPPTRILPCDWNRDGATDSRDWYDFLGAYFAGDADWNGDGVTDQDDFDGMRDCAGAG